MVVLRQCRHTAKPIKFTKRAKRGGDGARSVSRVPLSREEGDKQKQSSSNLNFNSTDCIFPYVRIGNFAESIAGTLVFCPDFPTLLKLNIEVVASLTGRYISE